MITIPIPIQKKEYFLKVLELLSPFYPFNTLTKREREVLSLFLLINYEKNEIPYNDRMSIIFNYNMRREIAERMGISIFNLNNLMKSLRDKGFLTADSIPRKYLIHPDTHGEFEFRFQISE